MNIKFVSESEIDRNFAAPYNPPVLAEGEDDEWFTDEYWSAHGEIVRCLAQFGREDDYGEGDFTMNQDFGLSRNISVELSTKRLWTPKVLDAIQDTLKTQTSDYRVCLHHSLLDQPDFYLLVEKTTAIGFSSDCSLLKHFGTLQR